MPKKNKIDEQVGRSLKRLRLERGLTVTALAREGDVSPAMISRIETGQVSPSLVTLSSLAEALNVQVMALLASASEAADVHHVRAGHGLPSRRVTASHSHEYQMLGKHGGPGGSFEAARIKIEHQDVGTFPTYQHEGYVFIEIASGSAIYKCGEELFEMHEGDTITFDAKLSHGFLKIGSDGVEFVTVSTHVH
jgi:DNA-binding XRE family transcriptional regulator/mannose-6-phosphate isomerase-like protein (cupin superfamily)